VRWQSLKQKKPKKAKSKSPPVTSQQEMTIVTFTRNGSIATSALEAIGPLLAAVRNAEVRIRPCYGMGKGFPGVLRSIMRRSDG
jgi:hypothetical protein